MPTAAATATTVATIGAVCSKCGAMKKSGKSSCCGRGGSWFKTCGSAGNSNFDHTWYEGIQACKGRAQSNRAIGQQLNAAQQNNTNTTDDAGMINTFASTQTKISTPMSSAMPIIVPAYTSVNASINTSTSTSTDTSMLMTVPFHSSASTSPVHHTSTTNYNRPMTAEPASIISTIYNISTSALTLTPARTLAAERFEEHFNDHCIPHVRQQVNRKPRMRQTIENHCSNQSVNYYHHLLSSFKLLVLQTNVLI